MSLPDHHIANLCLASISTSNKFNMIFDNLLLYVHYFADSKFILPFDILKYVFHKLKGTFSLFISLICVAIDFGLVSHTLTCWEVRFRLYSAQHCYYNTATGKVCTNRINGIFSRVKIDVLEHSI